MYRIDSYLYEDDVQPEYDHEPIEASRADYEKVKTLANQFLWKRIGLMWDDLPDNTTLWSFIKPKMTRAEMQDSAEAAALERMRESGYEV